MKRPVDTTLESPTPAQAYGKFRHGIMTRTTPADQGLVQRPTLTPHLKFHDIGEQRTLLVSEAFNTLLHGALLSDLLPLLDGRHVHDEIVAALDGAHAATDVIAAVVSLSAKGYVISAEHGMDESQAAYWSSLGASPRWVEQRLEESRVTVDGDRGRLIRHLDASGVRVTAADPDLTVVVCNDYLDAGHAEVNRRRLDANAPWMLVRPLGMEALFGPVFRTDRQGPCWECLAYRLRNHQEIHSFLRNVEGEEAAFKPFAANPAVLEALFGLIGVEIVKWLILGAATRIHDHAVAVNVGTLESSPHLVMRRPQCLACGDEELYRPDRLPVPLRLEASPKTHWNSGGARTMAPDATLAKYRHLVSPISGVVTWLTRTTDETDSWLHVYWSGSNLGTRRRTLSSLRRGLRNKCAGKGTTRNQSKVSAFCEAVERYSGVCHGDEIRVRKRFIDFAEGDDAIHPNDAQLFSELQFDNAASINAKGHPNNIVPRHLEPDADTDWTPVWSFTQQRHRYLPTSMLYYSMSTQQRDPADLIADSNGCAAGNTVEEAILQGFYELVERDAFAIWWYNRLRVPAVDLSSFDDRYLASAPDYYARHERDLWILDITSDIGIPAFVALSRRPEAETEDIIYGAGAHADPRIAALRAVAELNQCLTWLPRPRVRTDRPMIDDPLALWWWNTARIANCSWLVPDGPRRKASHFPVPESTDTRDDVEECRLRVEAAGMEFLVLDQTRPDIGLPVVRVIVPGMRHFWARFAPGRLFDVPVRMGVRLHPLAEAELNAAPVIA